MLSDNSGLLNEHTRVDDDEDDGDEDDEDGDDEDGEDDGDGDDGDGDEDSSSSLVDITTSATEAAKVNNIQHIQTRPRIIIKVLSLVLVLVLFIIVYIHFYTQSSICI